MYNKKKNKKTDALNKRSKTIGTKKRSKDTGGCQKTLQRKTNRSKTGSQTLKIGKQMNNQSQDNVSLPEADVCKAHRKAKCCVSVALRGRVSPWKSLLFELKEEHGFFPFICQCSCSVCNGELCADFKRYHLFSVAVILAFLFALFS